MKDGRLCTAKGAKTPGFRVLSAGIPARVGRRERREGVPVPDRMYDGLQEFIAFCGDSVEEMVGAAAVDSHQGRAMTGDAVWLALEPPSRLRHRESGAVEESAA